MTIKAYSIEEELSFHHKLNRKKMSIADAAKLIKKQMEEQKFPHSSSLWSDDHLKQLKQ